MTPPRAIHAKLPAAKGYRMPAEWEPHESTWLAWPHFRGDWPGKFEPILWVYAEIIRNLARHERVELIVNNTAAERQARKLLDRANAFSKNIRFHRQATNRAWLRDSGGIFVARKPPGFARPDRPFGSAQGKLGGLSPHGSPPSLLALNFRFNAWAKYSNWRHDEKIGALMANAAYSQEVRPLHRNTRVVLEGGSIDVNGRGTILTTEECLLSKIQQRNPGFTKDDYAEIFRRYLGVTNGVWLGNGIAGDDTHGHVDDLARFVDPATVVTVVEDDSSDANYMPLRDNL